MSMPASHSHPHPHPRSNSHSHSHPFWLSVLVCLHLYRWLYQWHCNWRCDWQPARFSISVSAKMISMAWPTTKAAAEMLSIMRVRLAILLRLPSHCQTCAGWVRSCRLTQQTNRQTHRQTGFNWLQLLFSCQNTQRHQFRSSWELSSAFRLQELRLRLDTSSHC